MDRGHGDVERHRPGRDSRHLNEAPPIAAGNRRLWRARGRGDVRWWQRAAASATAGSFGIIRATVPLPPNAQLAAARPNVAISPDGRFLAFVGSVDGTSRLFVRPVDAFEMTPVNGTDSASGPFFSPDGEWIGFFAMAG